MAIVTPWNRDGDTGVYGEPGGFAIPFYFGTDTGGTPIDQYIEYDHATVASVTEIYIDQDDRNGVDISAILALMAAGDQLKIISDDTPTEYAFFTIVSVTDSGDFYTIVVTHLASSGTMSLAEEISLSWEEKGGQGDTGAQGDTGVGDTGVQGGQGDTGIQGGQGDTGVGDTGVAGGQGDTGVGDTGVQGGQGDTGVGDTGATGSQGGQGDTGVGDTGIQGGQGDTGDSATEQGDTGVAGGQGDTGVAGGQGDTGVAGGQGDTGIQGGQGDTGVGDTGVQGGQGDTGIQGGQGDTGDSATQQGDTGVAGGQGDTGVAGGQGDTGVGDTGVAGGQGDTGVAGGQGDTGVGDTGAQGEQGDTGATEQYRNIEIIIDGGGAAITTGIKGDIIVGYACTITAAILLADQDGAIAVDIWKCTYGDFNTGVHPVDGDSIVGTALAIAASGDKYQDTTLTSWTTSIAAGSVLRFNVDSCATIERCTVALKLQL